MAKFDTETCPHDGAVLTAHKGVNEGFFHCNTCGDCFDEDGNLRAGVAGCAIVTGQAAVLDSTQYLERITELERQLEANPSKQHAATLEKSLEERDTEIESLKAQLEEATTAKSVADASDPAKNPGENNPPAATQTSGRGGGQQQANP